ncbi:MAG: metallopeptidase TldD-related protein [Candidatus Wallbacteria bacterium]|nr:metallopeptidase TldD-related protein [Candidatus Wallbacteria bacterium]
MIDKLINCLRERGIDIWQIRENGISSAEAFLNGSKLEMLRLSDLSSFNLKIFKPAASGEKDLGIAQAEISAGATNDELIRAVDQLAATADQARVPWFPMPDSGTRDFRIKTATDADLLSVLETVSGLLKETAASEDFFVNHAEIFSTQSLVSHRDSSGSFLQQNIGSGILELAAEVCSRTGTECQIYLTFSGNDKDFIRNTVCEQIKASRAKIQAVPTPAGLKCPVIITRPAVTRFMDYFARRADAACNYGSSQALRPGDSIQGQDPRGDLLDIELIPCLENSSYSSWFDQDGVILKKTRIIEQGKLKNYWGSAQYCHYLGLEPVGRIENILVSGGKHPLSVLRQPPCLEVHEFSAFFIIPGSGYFQGEIRLGWYSDGKSRSAVTGGSVSGRISDVCGNMLFSSEILQSGCFRGPVAVRLDPVSIGGGG